MPKLYGKTLNKKIYENNKSLKIGIIPIRTYYNTSRMEPYYDFIVSMAKFADMLVNANHQIYFIPFCRGNIKEDDLLIINDITKLMTKKVIIFNEYNVKSIYKICGEMDFNICMRFHSHIFSTIHGVPFISLTCGRKCIEYMNEIKLNSIYKLKEDDYDLPYKFDPNELYKFFLEQLSIYNYTHEKLKNISFKFEKMIDNILPEFVKNLRELSNGSNIILHPDISQICSPPLSDKINNNEISITQNPRKIILKTKIMTPHEILHQVPQQIIQQIQQIHQQIIQQIQQQIIQQVPQQVPQ